MAKPNQSTKPRGVAATLEGIKKIKQKIAELEKQETQESNKKVWTQDYIAERAGVSLSTYKRFIAGNPVEPDYVTWITGVFGLRPEDVISPDEWNQAVVNLQPRQNNDIDWRLVCSKMLKKQQETQRLRSKATEMGFELNIYVPLGLVERQHQQRRTGYIEAKQLNQLEPEVIVNIYQHDEFLRRFVEDSQGSENRHTAIIGEAGAGKTTLLSKIASYIQKNTENLFVFISLSNLEGQNLHEYLLKQWLCEAIGVSYPEFDITSEIEKKFIKRFRQGGVWLLLDGVDEMQNSTPLHSIEYQLKDWLNQVRVVLTCRNNIWDASVNNGINGFDTFKAQNFESEQVDKFIQNWFDGANDKQKGDLLKARLQEPGRERIRDLVQNPLRLSLLCQTFDVNKASFPETKAALYKQFILYLQEWKQHFYPIDRKNQNKLHKALGNLALVGINSETKFRFRESVARQEMGNNLFELARDVIWLHQVDRDAQTDEAVFAFFHPNFQEYFAALAINDWHYFLNHMPYNPDKGTYRIFEQHWKEVILLWLGRQDIDENKKIEFMYTLCQFEDRCGNFYKYRAFFIAAAGIAEFESFAWADDIVQQLLKWGISECWRYVEPIRLEARASLKETHRAKAIEALTNLIDNCENETTSLIALEILAEIDKSNTIILPTVTSIFNNSKNEFNMIRSASILGYINHQISTDTLINFYQNLINEDSILLAVDCLHTVNQAYEVNINILINLILSTMNHDTRNFCVIKLGEMANISSDIIYILSSLFIVIKDDSIRECIIFVLANIARNNTNAINIILNTIIDETNFKIAGKAIYHLQQIAKYNSSAIAALVALICETQNEDIRILSMYNLAMLSKYNSLAKLVFMNIIDKFKLESETLYKLAAYCLISVHEDNLGLWDNTLELEQIGSEDNDINLAFRLLIVNEHSSVDSKENSNIIDEFIRLTQICQNENNIMRVVTTLSDIGKGNLKVCRSLLVLMQNSQRKDINEMITSGLQNIITSNLIPEIISDIKALLDNNYKNNLELYDYCWQLIWFCTKNINYPAFYLAWHNQIYLSQKMPSACLENIICQIKSPEENLFIYINAKNIASKTNENIIAKLLCIKIFQNLSFSSTDIPKILDVAELQLELIKLVEHLTKQKLFILIDRCKPVKALLSVCYTLADAKEIHIGWITDKPLKAPLQKFLPNQPNLLSAIQSWINKID